MNSIIAAIAPGSAALFATAVASGLLWRDDESDDEDEDEEAADEIEREDERGWIWLGFLTHSILSLRARLARLFGRRKRMPLPDRETVLGRRIEPRFDEFADTNDEDLSEEDDTAQPRARKARTPKAPRRSSGGDTPPALEMFN